MAIREQYEHLEMDNDGCYYWFVNNDVKPFHKWYDKAVGELIEKWQSHLKQALYIKWNYLFFTINGNKYWCKLSVSTEEWDNANAIINDFNAIKGVSNVVYDKGVLD